MNYNDFELKNLSVDEQLSMSSAFPVLMRKVYVWMTLALVITGFTAYGVATSPGVLQLIFGNQILFWGMIIAELALVIGVSAAINRLSLTTATLMFILYSVINGALFSSIFLIYTASSIATVFFITAGTFGVIGPKKASFTIFLLFSPVTIRSTFFDCIILLIPMVIACFGTSSIDGTGSFF